MSLKKVLPFFFFSVLFGIWFYSLFSVYSSASNWGTPTIPLTVDSNMKTMFFASTILLAPSLFLMGLAKLDVFSRIAKSHSSNKKESLTC
jgi:hypothetical protein